MESIRCCEVYFHYYKGTREEGFHSSGAWAVVGTDNFEIVDEEVFDYSECKEVRYWVRNDEPAYFDMLEDVDDDYKIKVSKCIFKLPNGEEFTCLNLVDELVDWETFECESGISFIEGYKVTADGCNDIDYDEEGDEYEEDDDDCGW